MSNRKTVAIIGLSEDDNTLFANKIANENTILLFDPDAFVVNAVYLQMRAAHPNATLEVMSCAINACWEADVIVLSNYYLKERNLTDQIIKVVTGKTILVVMGKKEKFKVTNAVEKPMHLFPFSKVVFVFTAANDTEKYFCVEGNDEESKQNRLTFFTNSGFEVRK